MYQSPQLLPTLREDFVLVVFSSAGEGFVSRNDIETYSLKPTGDIKTRSLEPSGENHEPVKTDREYKYRVYTP